MISRRLMLAYHPYWLEAFSITRDVERLARDGLVMPDQLRIMRAAFTNPLYVPRPSERVALFLLMCIALAGIYFISLQVAPAHSAGTTPWHFLGTGFLSILALEVLIKRKKTYRAGIDDAALYAGLALIVTGATRLATDFSESNAMVTASLIAFPLLVLAAVRYVDRLAAIAAFICMLFIFYALQRTLGIIEGVYLPFVLMGLSAAVYAWHRTARTKQRLAPWLGCINAVGITSLMAFYFASNTVVVQHVLVPSSLDHATAPRGLVPLSYALTLGIPAVYIVVGLAVRDRAVLRVGLFIEALSLATARYYNNSVALEHVLIILGLTLILFSVATIQMLKSKTTGFTFKKVPLQIPEEVPLNAIVLYDRAAAQKEAVRAFEAGKSQFGGGASLGW